MDHRRLAALDLNLLVLLDALLDERSVTGAGRRVALSQPAVSRGLARLREEFDDALLVRSGRFMLPTPRAEQLRPLLRRVLHDALRLLDARAAFVPEASSRQFTIAASEYAEQVLVAPLLARLSQEVPSLTWVVRPSASNEIPRAESGDVDLGIALLTAPVPGLRREPLWSDGYVVLGSARDAARLAALAAAPARYAAALHAVISPDGQGDSDIDRWLAARGLPRRVVYRTPALHGALAMARASELVVTVPSRLASAVALQGLSANPVAFLPPLEIQLVRHERFIGDPGLDWLCRQVRDAALALARAPAPPRSPPASRARPAARR